jgi:hypothetical protein
MMKAMIELFTKN